MKKILYDDDKVSLYYNEDTKVYSEYKKTDNGLGISSYQPPVWFIRMKKIDDILTLENNQ
jgi:hypothetical protein